MAAAKFKMDDEVLGKGKPCSGDSDEENENREDSSAISVHSGRDQYPPEAYDNVGVGAKVGFSLLK